MQNLFKGDAPFLQRLGNVFTNAGVNLQGIFATLLSGIGSFLSTLFGTGTSTASQIGNMFLQSAISVGVSWGTQAIGMSLISMISMEAAMNITDVILTGGAILKWSIIPIMLFAGFITPLPYNYWRLKALGKSCH